MTFNDEGSMVDFNDDIVEMIFGGSIRFNVDDADVGSMKGQVDGNTEECVDGFIDGNKRRLFMGYFVEIIDVIDGLDCIIDCVDDGLLEGMLVGVDGLIEISIDGVIKDGTMEGFNDG